MRANRARVNGAAVDVRERMVREELARRRRFAGAEENERTKVAQELRDGACQLLTAVSLGLRELSELAPPGSEVNRRVARLRALVNTTGEELHKLAMRLRSQALSDF